MLLYCIVNTYVAWAPDAGRGLEPRLTDTSIYVHVHPCTGVPLITLGAQEMWHKQCQSVWQLTSKLIYWYAYMYVYIRSAA